MSDSRVAGGLDRLPWLADEPVRKAPTGSGRGWNVTGWAISALLVVSGTSFWFGSQSEIGEQAPPSSQATAPVQSPRAAPSQDLRIAAPPTVAPVAPPQVRQTPLPQVRIAPPPVRRGVESEPAKAVAAQPSIETPAPSSKSAVVVAPAPVAKVAVPLRPWPPRVVAGAAGRLVQVGAYGSRIQAKRGWVAMARAYPALKRLPAVVAVTRNSKGRFFYRFNIGTTSQAHSEILCQRMRRISLSCAVVGLPWKAKVER